MAERVFLDCRQVPSDSNCQLYLSGPRDELLDAAMAHAVRVHGHEDTPANREELAGYLQPEPA